MQMFKPDDDEVQLLLAAFNDEQAAGQARIRLDTQLCKCALTLPRALEERSRWAEPWHLLSVQV